MHLGQTARIYDLIKAGLRCIGIVPFEKSIFKEEDILSCYGWVEVVRLAKIRNWTYHQLSVEIILPYSKATAKKAFGHKETKINGE